MRIEAFDPKEHWLLMLKLLKAREMNEECFDDLPKIGFIAITDNNRPIASVFLRKMEGNYGHFEGLITNPESSSEKRHEAIEKLFEATFQKAKEIGISRLISFTKDDGTLARCKRWGFEALPHTAICLTLLKE